MKKENVKNNNNQFLTIKKLLPTYYILFCIFVEIINFL